MDLVVEFHTIGSTVGVDLARYWEVEFHVIFDSPVAEQFLEMYGTRSAYWKKIQRSEEISMKEASKIMCYSDACQRYLTDNYVIKAKITILPCVLQKAGGKLDYSK